MSSRPAPLAVCLAAGLVVLGTGDGFAAPPKPKPAHPRHHDGLPADAMAAAAAVSRLRSSRALPPVAADGLLVRAAQAQANAMARAGAMSHSVAGDFSSRMRQAGLRSVAAAENIAMGQHSLAEAMESWTKSSGHLSNMLMKQVTRIGLARATGSDGTIYWAMVLASPEPKPVEAQTGGPFLWGAPLFIR